MAQRISIVLSCGHKILQLTGPGSGNPEVHVGDTFRCYSTCPQYGKAKVTRIDKL